MDDFFEDNQTHEISNGQSGGFQEQQYTAFDAFENGTPPQGITFNTYVSPEQQLRKDKLRLIEDERLAQIREKDQQESLLKQQQKQKAQEYLQVFKKQQEADIAQKRSQNKQKQEIWLENLKNHYQNKNSWEQIASNIALRDGEYPGQKDVTQMRQAILNKRSDLTK
ncbi:unnamed protein product (macronuclear) [Paramecium tetraurelia]|uniref:Clathrin light chain n=1 Tax=Paramecium tetraurelia TaxID=5888 RepID=A0CM88_PARTE|nr:uncharacterized protein GSPATT00008384001 [Paramecium tetraurelia]CAK71905.1 unnamed protein product [Paramecium tetraurelia]|eukprot:XP_001439302.1 hypothetical protein (macronuclear) [Paramecium tetraurelia strain d4-2]